jgi:YihY family inner membrane protein
MVKRGRRVSGRALNTLPARVVRKFIADNGPNQAVLIAWNVLFSIFPLALAMATVLGLVLSSTGVKADAVYQTVLAIIPDDQGRAQALSGLAAIKHQSGLFFLVALAGFIWSGSSLFGAMESAFDQIFKCPSRPFLRQKLMGVLMMVLFTILAGISIAASAVLPLLQALPLVPASLTASATAYLLPPVIGVVSGVLLFGLLYYVVPNRRRRLAEVWPGALLAGLAFYLLTLLFPLYLHFNKGLNQYGASFAFLFVLMTFFYFLGLITMLGAELNGVLFLAPAGQPAGKGRRVPAPAAQGAERSPRGVARTAMFGVLAAVIGVFAFSRRPALGDQTRL